MRLTVTLTRRRLFKEKTDTKSLLVLLKIERFEIVFSTFEWILRHARYFKLVRREILESMWWSEMYGTHVLWLTAHLCHHKRVETQTKARQIVYKRYVQFQSMLCSKVMKYDVLKTSSSGYIIVTIVTKMGDKSLCYCADLYALTAISWGLTPYKTNFFPQVENRKQQSWWRVRGRWPDCTECPEKRPKCIPSLKQYLFSNWNFFQFNYLVTRSVFTSLKTFDVNPIVLQNELKR